MQCDISPERQNALDRLASGKAFLPKSAVPTTAAANSGTVADSRSSTASSSVVDSPSADADAALLTGGSKKKDKDKDARPAKVEGTAYRVVWSAMLIVEICLR